MTTRFVRAAVVAGAAAVLSASAANAQPLGTFTWQLQPFCNVVTVNLTQQGAVYTVDGFDDQCGAPQRAALVGLATPNPDGSIAVGFNIVTAPGGRGVQVAARITLPSASGTWSDSAGNTGTFAFGVSTGGSPRPAPTVPGSAIALGSISAQHLTPGTVGAGQINPGQVQARVGGTCAHGQALRGVNPDGTVVCTDALSTVDVAAGNFGSAGDFSAIAIGADGLPVVSHNDTSAGAARVTRCGNAACTAGNVSTTVAVGDYTAIAIGVDGLPVVSYRDLNLVGLGVTHCGNATCTAGNISTLVDAGGRGYFTAIAIGTDGLPVISHHEVSAGTLRVTHCGNVACTAGNVSTTVDDPANVVGELSAIAIGADGLPIISHQDTTARTLRVTHCGNVLCSAGNISTTVDPIFGVGSFSSIAIGADGLAVISHRDSGATRLRVTHCGNALCTAGNVTNVADAPGYSVGFTPSIAIGVDGLPIISHQAESLSALRVTHCGNAACTSGNVSTTVDDPANDVGSRTSIAIGADGLPIISHEDRTVFALRVTHCGNAACTAGNVSTTVDDGENPFIVVGHFPSIAIGVDELPIISHKGGSALRVTHCGNVACTAGNSSVMADAPLYGSVGAFTSLAIGVDGLPVISHQDAKTWGLRVTHCGNVTCTAGNVSTTLDDPVNIVGYQTSIAIGVDGLPIISHYDSTAGTLKVAKCSTRTCQ